MWEIEKFQEKTENFRTFILKHLSCFLLMNSTNIHHALCSYMARKRAKDSSLRLRTEASWASISRSALGEDNRHLS